MGNFEKLVVLVVLFLSAVVLAVSLSDGETKAGAGPGAVLDDAAVDTDAAAAKPAVAETAKSKTNTVVPKSVTPKPAATKKET